LKWAKIIPRLEHPLLKPEQAMKLYQRGKTWYVTHWTGEKQIKMSTGCTDKAEAEKKVKMLLAPIITQPDDEIRAATAAAIIDKLARDHKKAIAEQLQLSDCLDKYPHISSKGNLKNPRCATQGWLGIILWDIVRIIIL